MCNFVMRAIILTYAGLTFLMVTDLLLYLSKDISLPGHLLDWILFWTWLIMTAVVIFSNLKEKWSKVYGAVLIVFTMLTMLPMMIPFLTILTFAVTPEAERFRISDDTELQELHRFVVGIPTIVRIKSFGFYERIVGQTEFEIELGDKFYTIEEAKAIRILDNNGRGSLKIEFKFEGGTVIKTL